MTPPSDEWAWPDESRARIDLAHPIRRAERRDLAAAPPGACHELVAADPDRFFEPPFGGSTWVAMRLEGATDWTEVREILEEAYRQVAPRHLIDLIGHR